MKSERRHELQHNELATWLIKTGESLKGHQNGILAAVLMFCLLIIVYSFWSSSSATSSLAAWNGIAAGVETGNLESLVSVKDGFEGTMPGQMANLVLADIYLGQGCQLRFTDRATSNGQMDRATKAYAAGVAQGDASMQERAAFGLARAKEAAGELSEAITAYENVCKKWPNGIYATAAKRQLEFLNLPETRRMFGSLLNFQPTRVYSTDAGTPGKRPNSLPDETPAAGGKNSEPKSDPVKPDAKAKTEDKAKDTGKKTSK